MTGIPAVSDEGQPAELTAEAEAGPGAARAGRRPDSFRVSQIIGILEHAQDVVTVTIGILLIALAAVLLIAGITDFIDRIHGSVAAAASHLLDQALLVLILVEIVHTVVLSLRSHRLVAQPFIVVGLIAVIRRILFILTPGSKIDVTTSQLALLIAMVAVFVAGLIAVSIFEKTEQ